MALQLIRGTLSSRATVRGSINVFRKRDIDDVLPSQIVEQQFPEFIRSDYPKMVDFAKTYFKFLEQTENGKIDDLKNLDKTTGEYILRIRNEFAFNATKFDFLEDKEFIRYAKYFYSSKGTEESIKFLFRVMFEEAVEIDYPAERIFKPSTARWYQEQSVKVVLATNSLAPTDFIGNYLQIRNKFGAEQTIEVSNAVDITEKVSELEPSTIFEVYFTTELLIPVFIGDEVFGTEFSSTIIPSLTSIKIISPGTNFRIGQVLKLDSITGTGAVAVITAVRGNGEIRNVKFLRFGKNYTTNFFLGVSPEGVFTESGSSFVTDGEADINKAIADVTEGFLEVKTILRSDYVLNDSPVTAGSPFSNYVYSAYTGVYVSQSSNRQVFFLEEDYSALLLSSIGAVCKYPGKYLDQTGMASNSSVLQDNKVFQDFSYVIKSTNDVTEYKDTITALAHPSGFKMTGELSIENIFDSDTNLTDVSNLSDLYVTDFDFTASSVLDGRITYTRTGIATKTNSLGLVEAVAANTPRIDYDPITLLSRGLLIESAGTNLLFDSGSFTAWTSNSSTSPTSVDNVGVSPTGTTTAWWIPAGATGINQKNYTIPANTSTYVWSVYVKDLDPSATVVFGVNGVFGVNTSTATFTFNTLAFSGTSNGTVTAVGNGWYRLTQNFTNNGTGTIFIMRVESGANTNQKVLFWGAQLEAGSTATSYIPSALTFTSRASSGTFIDSTGTLQTAATNVARLQYNPTNLSAMPTLLLETSSTNLLPYSEQFDNAVWGKQFATVTSNTVVSPSGETTADTVSFGGATPYDAVYQNHLGIGTYTMSVWVRVATGTQRFVMTTYSPSENQTNSPWFTATTVWQRFQWTGTVTVASSWYPVLGGEAVVKSFYIWGAQLEAGLAPSSYIPTTTAAVTRAADVYTSAAATRGADTTLITGSNFDTWFNPREGTLYAEYVKNIISPTVSVASFESSTTNHIRFISAAPAVQRFDVLSSGSTEASLVMNATETTGLITKVAGAYKNNDIAAAAFGVVSTDTVAALPTGLNRLGIGTNSNATQLNGYVRRLTYYPVRLSNDEIRTMTTPVSPAITTQDYSLNLDFIGNTVSINT